MRVEEIRGKGRSSCRSRAASLRPIELTASATDWVENLSLGWLVLVVTAACFFAAAVVYVVVMWLAVGKRREAFRAVSPGMLPPMGLLFGLIPVIKYAAPRASAGRNGSVRAAAGCHAGRSGRHRAVRVERRAARVGDPHVHPQRCERGVAGDGPSPGDADRDPGAARRGVQIAIRLTPRSDGEKAAQQQMISSVQSALDARRQRIILSESSVNWVKWSGVILVAVLTLIAFVHCENRLAAGLALGLFTAAVAGSLILLAVQQRPFGGEFAVRPDPLVQVLPQP